MYLPVTNLLLKLEWAEATFKREKCQPEDSGDAGLSRGKTPRAAKRGLHFLPRDVGVQDPTPKLILLLRGHFNPTLNLLAVTIRQKELQTADSQASMTFAKKLLTPLKE